MNCFTIESRVGIRHRGEFSRLHFARSPLIPRGETRDLEWPPFAGHEENRSSRRASQKTITANLRGEPPRNGLITVGQKRYSRNFSSLELIGRSAGRRLRPIRGARRAPRAAAAPAHRSKDSAAACADGLRQRPIASSHLACSHLAERLLHFDFFHESSTSAQNEGNRACSLPSQGSGASPHH